jgi:hypothetical protein
MSPAKRTLWTRPLSLAVAAVWLAAVCGPPAALMAWREQRLAAVDSPEAQAQWDAFRQDMRRQSGREGPVQRKVPKSAEPPERVWLRDHIHLAVIAWMTLVGVLGGFLAALVLGVARGSSSEDQTPRDGHDEEQDQRDSQHARERRHG